MDRLSQLLCLFAERLPSLARSELVRCVYLADYQAHRYLGRGLTDATYRLDGTGPCDPTIAARLAELVQGGYLTVAQIAVVPGHVEGQAYARTARRVDVDLAPEEAAVVNSVVELLSLPRQRHALHDIVDATEPVRAAIDDQAFGRPLDLSIIDGADRIPGLELESVLQADEDLAAGKGVPLAERARA